MQLKLIQYQSSINPSIGWNIWNAENADNAEYPHATD